MAEAQASGPLLVCLPSVGRGARDLCALCEALVERGIRSCSVEPVPGGAGDDITVLAQQAIDAAGNETRLVFLGHAYGAHVARVAAAMVPDRTVGVVAVAIGAKEYPGSLKTLIDIAADPGADRQDRLAALAEGFFLGTPPESWLSGWNRDLLAFQRLGRKRLADPALLGAGGAPVLDLIGSDDPFRPPASYDDLSATLGPRVTVRIIDGARHAIPDERPAAAAEAIADWLTGLSGQHDHKIQESAR